MIANNSFSQTVDLLHRSMSATTLRQAVYANNMANVNTPNFKRTEVTFESQLGRALDSRQNRPALLLQQTHPDHISNWQPMDHTDVRPRRALDFLTQTDANGNNVDPDEEFSLLLRNQMRYIMLSQMATFEFSQINLVLRA